MLQPLTCDLDIKFKLKYFNCRFSEDSAMKTMLIGDAKKKKRTYNNNKKQLGDKSAGEDICSQAR